MTRCLSELRHDFTAPDRKHPPIPVEPLRVRRAREIAPVELGRAERLLGGRIRNAFARGLVLKFRKFGKLRTPALAYRLRQLVLEIAKERKRLRSRPFL